VEGTLAAMVSHDMLGIGVYQMSMQLFTKINSSNCKLFLSIHQPVATAAPGVVAPRSWCSGNNTCNPADG